MARRRRRRNSRRRSPSYALADFGAPRSGGISNTMLLAGAALAIYFVAKR